MDFITENNTTPDKRGAGAQRKKKKKKRGGGLHLKFEVEKNFYTQLF